MGNTEFWSFPEIPLDAMNKPLDLWAITGLKGHIIVNVEEVDMTKVLFDCNGLHRPEVQLSHLFHDYELGSWQ